MDPRDQHGAFWTRARRQICDRLLRWLSKYEVAHLVHMHLVACFEWSSNFWQLSEEDQRRVLVALDSTEAKVAVSEIPPPDPERAAGWQRVGLTRYYIHVLSAGRQQVGRNQTPVAASDLNVN
jgi:hypothetical protein